MKVTKAASVLAIVLAMFAGALLGAIGEAVHAQAKPPVYMIANNEVSNNEGYSKEYLPLAKKSILEHGGVYVAAGKGYAIAGEPPKGRLVILRWDSMEQLMAWQNSPDYQAAKKTGEKYAKYNVMAVDGVPAK